MSKIVEKELGLTKLLQKQNGAIFGDSVSTISCKNVQRNIDDKTLFSKTRSYACR